MKKMLLMSAFLLVIGMLMSVTSATAQITIENRTNCDFEVKVNNRIFPMCGVNPAGPLYFSPAGMTIMVPGPPPGEWVPAFGVNQVGPWLPPVIVGGCGPFLPVVTPYGMCVVTITYVSPTHLLLT